MLVTDKYERSHGAGILFYRHSDGYPDGVRDTLSQFLRLVEEGKIRDNAEQAAGWLIIIGHEEYAEGRAQYPQVSGWKCGAYEPAIGIHGDIEYFYVVDLDAKTVVYFDDFDADKSEVADFLKRTDGKPLELVVPI